MHQKVIRMGNSTLEGSEVESNLLYFQIKEPGVHELGNVEDEFRKVHDCRPCVSMGDYKTWSSSK